MEKKIEVESKFSAFFLGLIVAQYTNLYFEKYNELKKPEILMTYVQRVPGNIKDVEEIFILAFRDGYNSGDVEGVIKECFNKSLYSILVSWTSFLELARSNPYPSLTDAELTSIFNDLNNTNSNLKKIHKLKSEGLNNLEENNVNKLIRKLYKNAIFEINQEFTNIYKASLKSKDIQSMQIRYMDWIISKMVKRGAKFHKNDILDMFIANVLEKDDTILVSFDSDMQDFIKSIGHVSQNYIEKLYNKTI